MDQNLVYFQTEGTKYNPDYVIVFINKLLLERARLGIYQNGGLVYDHLATPSAHTSQSTITLSRNSDFFKEKHPLVTSSYILSFLNYHYQRFALMKTMIDYDSGFWQVIKENQSNQYNEKAVEIFSGYLIAISDRFETECKSKNCQLILVNIDPNFDPRISELLAPYQYLDLSDKLQSLQEQQSLTFKYDQHYNPDTHKLIGEILTLYIQENIQ